MDKGMDTAKQAEIQLEDSWRSRLANEFEKPYFAELRQFLKTEKAAGKSIYPPGPEIFNAYNSTPFNTVKVVIIGQDPYHGQGQAHGLCFSVRRGVRPPPSLVNIYKELRSDLSLETPAHGCLESWTHQGVFLLNAMLTVEKDQPASHKHIGWQHFTDATIRIISDQRPHVVFILWGAFAQQKEVLIDAEKHLILKSAHPSPFSADKGFFGCRHFSKTNTWLLDHNEEPVNWTVV